MEGKNRHVKSLLYALNVLKSNKYKEHIREIYLYGSCARGHQKFDSDVDLFLFVDEGVSDQLIRELRIAVSPDDYTLPEVEIKISKTNYFSNSRIFQTNLEREAILLWKRK